MKRRLVKQGAATLMVSLPAKWAKEQGLDKGDEISLEESDNKLILSKEESGKIKKETTMTITSETESSIRTIITSAYRLGYDKITIKIPSKKFIQIIKSVVENQLLGFEIIKETENICTIENITEPAKEQFDNIFTKVLLNIEELFNLTERSLEGEKPTFLDIEQKITEFDNFCRRVISKNGLNKNTQLQDGFHTALNRGQRELYHVLIYLNENKSTKLKETIKLLDDCKKVFLLLKDAYYKKDIALIEKIHELNKKRDYSALKKGDPIIAHHLMSALRQFYLASSPLTGVLVEIEN
jgi:phosphate uptake regulator